MEESGDYSAARLKRLFRQASKRVHPDLADADGEAFLSLRREYEEALASLAGAARDRRASVGRAPKGPSEARRALLSKLHAFTRKIFTDEADAILDGMVRDAADYDPALAALLARYRDRIYASRREWSNDANLYYAHSVFISGARQLFLYFEEGKPLHRTLLLRSREAMEDWCRKVPRESTEVLEGLYAWIEAEADTEAVKPD